jgi:hypothetical protein
MVPGGKRKKERAHDGRHGAAAGAAGASARRSTKGIRSSILLAAVTHILLRDGRFHVTVITRAIGAVALASLVKNNQARPVRRTVSWYNKVGASRELARAGQALEQGKGSWG